MSLAENRTAELWRKFMHRKKEIEVRVCDEVLSVNEYPADYFSKFDPAKKFIKRAAVEVNEFPSLPEEMEAYILQEGLYAVFHYKGPGGDPSIFQYIYGEWLPQSGYFLDDRPHFEILGAKYKNADADSEEEIYIPVRQK